MKLVESRKSKVLFCGGGTLGPVTPLIAVLRRMREMRPDLEFSWIGTENGPEGALIEAEGVGFHALPIAKLARYPDKTWFTFPFDYLKARSEAKRILDDIKPHAVFSAGGFMQVPVIRLAATQGVPCAIHQLDYTPIRSNKIVAHNCVMLTSSFEYQTPQFGRVKAIRVATPCRYANRAVPSREAAAREFGFDQTNPIVLVMGGGTGSLALNQAIANSLGELLGRTQLIHVAGKGKSEGMKIQEGYRIFDLLDEKRMLEAYCAADLVVTRAGFGSLSELATLGKPSIVVPLPNSPQEENVRALGDAIIAVHQGPGFGVNLKQQIFELLDDASGRERLGRSLHQKLPTDDGRELAERWLGLIN